MAIPRLRVGNSTHPPGRARPRPASGRPRLRLQVLMLCLLCAAHAARGDEVSEYRLKAAFVYNFASFTEWPAEVGTLLRLCVYGSDPFGANLDSLQGREVGARRIEVQRRASADKLDDCQIVFISRSGIGNLPRILDNLGTAPVLTVADTPGAMRQGVALNMETERDRITFTANLAAARQNRLTLSAKLLRLATEVHQ